MNFFGLDVGTNSIKVVELAKEGKGFRLVTFGLSPSPPKGFSSESSIDLEILAESIKKLVKDSRINTNNVAVALSETQVYTRVISTPPLSEDELSSAIRWEAEQYIPLPLSDVRLDYQILSMPDKNIPGAKAEVLLVAAPITTLNKYLKVLEHANLKPVLVETEIISVARSLVSSSMPTSLLVDIGANTTEIAIVRQGSLSFTRSVATGGNALARAVSTDLGLEIGQAEEYKKSYGLDESKLSGKVEKAIKPIFDVIVSEMRRAISFYQKEKMDTVSRAVLTGGTSRLPGIVTYLAQVLGIEVLVGDPWQTVTMTDQQKATLSLDGQLFSAAVGLAMKNL